MVEVNATLFDGDVTYRVTVDSVETGLFSKEDAVSRLTVLGSGDEFEALHDALQRTGALG